MLFRLTCPAHGEGFLGALGQSVVHTLGRPAAALAGIYYKYRIAAIQRIFQGA